MEQSDSGIVPNAKPRDGPTFTLRNRIRRSIWSLCWFMFARWTPRPFHLWRVFLIRAFGGRVDWSAHVYPSAMIWAPWNLTLDARSCLGPKVNCYNVAPIELRLEATVSQGTFLCTATRDFRSGDFAIVSKPILIGEEAWIGAECFVGPGVQVQDRVILGARCVLFVDAEQGGIFVGNPAHKIGMR